MSEVNTNLSVEDANSLVANLKNQLEAINFSVEYRSPSALCVVKDNFHALVFLDRILPAIDHLKKYLIETYSDYVCRYGNIPYRVKIAAK